MSGPLAQQVREWANGASYTSDISTVNGDLSDISNGIRLHDLKGVRTTCAAFGVDSATIQGELPTPDVTITNEINDATSDFYNASLSCYRATSFTDRDFKAYLSQVAKGKRVLADVTKLLKVDGVH
jgi:hypothetical protein